MTCFRVDLRIADPQPVWDWLNEHVPAQDRVRSVAYKVPTGYYLKSVFRRQDHAEAFHRHWLSEADSHTVGPFCEPT